MTNILLLNYYNYYVNCIIMTYFSHVHTSNTTGDVEMVFK